MLETVQHSEADQCFGPLSGMEMVEAGFGKAAIVQTLQTVLLQFRVVAAAL